MIDDSILEFFDTEDQRSQFEIPAMRGTLGPDVVDLEQGDWIASDRMDITDKLLLEVPWISNFTQMASKDGKRRVFELLDE